MRRLVVVIVSFILGSSLSVMAAAPARAWGGPTEVSYYPPIYCQIEGASQNGSTKYALTDLDFGDECGQMGVAFRYTTFVGTYQYAANYKQINTQASNAIGGRHRPAASSAYFNT